MACAFAYQGLSYLPQGGENAMLLDQVKVRRREARCHIGVTSSRYVKAKHGGYDEDESIQWSFQLRDEMRSMQ